MGIHIPKQQQNDLSATCIYQMHGTYRWSGVAHCTWCSWPPKLTLIALHTWQTSRAPLSRAAWRALYPWQTWLSPCSLVSLSLYNTALIYIQSLLKIEAIL